MPNIRTMEDFVEDLVSDGKTPHDVGVVARNTRWKPVSKEAVALAKKLCEKFRKSCLDTDTASDNTSGKRKQKKKLKRKPKRKEK